MTTHSEKQFSVSEKRQLELNTERERRQRYGQFFTPTEIARFMVDWVLETNDGSLYDPAFGMGAFRKAAEHRPATRFYASEVDPIVLSMWQHATGITPDFVQQEDYLLTWGQQHANIVCNPPYMRFQKFTTRDAVRKDFQKHTGETLPGYANIASAFLLKSIHEMDGQGRLAYIMPMEFLNTGYGVTVKRKLLEKGHLKAIIAVTCEQEVFPDCTTTVGIILYDATTQHQDVEFHSVDSITQLNSVLAHEPVAKVNQENLNPNRKWLPYLKQPTSSEPPSHLIKLKNYGHFSRGIATGANQFFKIRPSEADALGIDDSEYRNCITESRQIKAPVFRQQDFKQLLLNDVPVLLFNAGPEPSRQAQEYIESGRQNGYDQRYLTRNRNPWYRTEYRSPAPILVSVFSRDGYKAILNQSDAVNLNCFHGFHPNDEHTERIDKIFLYLLSRAGRSIVELDLRNYGDALRKFEPDDLNSAHVPDQRTMDQLDRQTVQVALEKVQETGTLPENIEGFFSEAVRSR